MRHHAVVATLLLSWSAPAFARSSDGGSILFLLVIATVGAYWLFSTMVTNAVEHGMKKRKHEIDVKEQKERAQTVELAEEERAQTSKEVLINLTFAQNLQGKSLILLGACD